MPISCSKPPVFAFHLPQFHPIPENDHWWGKGFTEWTNVTKAKPLFHGHYQPHLPADLGFYDLRVPEILDQQADLATKYGIDGFAFWHYWFGNGKRLLEKPVDEFRKRQTAKVGYCLAWANESWSGIWHGNPGTILMEQTYPGSDDYINHFNAVLPHFNDSRYLKIDGKPVFVVYRPFNIPEPELFTRIWNDLALKAGFQGIYWIGVHYKPKDRPSSIHFDSWIISNETRMRTVRPPGKLLSWYRRFRKQPIFQYSYETACRYFLSKPREDYPIIPCAIPGWDNTPRSGTRGFVLTGSTPQLFRNHFRQVVRQAIEQPVPAPAIFIKSWNEWAEGNYLEPDRQWGHAYLEVIRDVLKEEFGQ